MLHLIAALVVSASLMPPGKQAYVDANGAPLAGGRLYTYAAGTSTPLATYSDEAGVTPNTNPVILDARGEATVFWGPAPYKIVLKDANDVTVWTQDNVYARGRVTVTGGSVPRTLEDHLRTLPDVAWDAVTASSLRVKSRGSTTARGEDERWADVVNVKDFGAKGDMSDDTLAINAALTAASGVQGTVFFPPGSYRFTAALQIPQNVSLQGLGPKFGSVLVPDGCAAFQILGAGRPGGWAFRIYVRDLTIQPVNTPASTKLIEIHDAYSIHFDHVWVYNVADNGSIAYDVTDSNDVLLTAPVIYGAANSTSTGIATHGAAWVRLLNPDLEVLNHAIANYGIGGGLDVLDPYIERSIVGVANYTASPVTVIGGVIAGVNPSTIPVADYSVAGNVLVFGTQLPTGTGTVPVYAISGWDNLFYDRSTRRLQLGPVGTTGAVAPASSLTVNPSGSTGAQYGVAVGPFTTYVGASDAFENDWVFLNGTTTKTARFFGPEAGTQLNLYTDGTMTAALGISIVDPTGAGSVVLVGGNASATVRAGLHGCVCSDTTSAAAVQCSVSGTTLSVVGTGTDGITYLCF